MLRLICGFEDMATTDSALRTDLARRFTLTSSGTMFAIAGEKSDRALRIDTGGAVRMQIPQTSDIYFGVRFKTDIAIGASPARLLSLQNDLGSNEIQIELTATGNIRVVGPFGSQIVLTTGANLAANTWYYLEFRVNRSTSTGGIVTIKVDGTQISNTTGLTTGTSGRTGYNFLTLGNNSTSPTVQASFDDIYILDTTGTPSTFLGPIATRLQLPDETVALNGTDDPGYTAFTNIGGGANFQDIDDLPVDDDATYITTPGTSRRDWSKLDNVSGRLALSADYQIFGVQINGIVRHDSSAIPFKLGVRSVAALDQSADQTPTSSYLSYGHVSSLNPSTSSAWTDVTLQAANFGVQT